MNAPTNPSPLPQSHYEGKTYRAFSTAHPSQNLLDDLFGDPKEEEQLKPYYYPTSQLSAQKPAERVLKRTFQSIIQQEIASKFKPENWYQSRFSDGSWGVLYSAESEHTSLKESLYHKRRFYQEELEQKAVSIDLRLIRLQLQTDCCVDFTQQISIEKTKLTSQDETGYSYCQNLAKQGLQQKTEMIRTPSARDEGGFCTPIFHPNCILKDEGHLKYVKCVLTKEKTEVFL